MYTSAFSKVLARAITITRVCRNKQRNSAKIIPCYGNEFGVEAEFKLETVSQRHLPPNFILHR